MSNPIAADTSISTIFSGRGNPYSPLDDLPPGRLP
jgi:hypothetical protein